MKNAEIKFEDIYDKLYNKYYERFEKMRIDEKNSLKRVIAGISCIWIAFALVTSEDFNNNLFIVILGVLLGIMGGGLLFWEWHFKKNNNYSELYKNEVITEFIKNIIPDFNYLPDFSLESKNKIIEEYTNAKFDNMEFNRSYTDDYINGKIHNDDIYMCDLFTYYEYINNKKETCTEKRFSGLFANVKINSSNKKVKIKILNKENSQIEIRNVVKLDFDEFNNNFIIVSDSSISAFQILTAEVMENLNKQLKENNIKFDISIINNNIYFRFYTLPIFEAPINGPAMKKENFYRYYKLLKFVMSFSDNINNIYKNLNI